MQNYDVNTNRAFAGIRKYGWIFIVLAVIGVIIFVLPSGESGNFMATPDPTTELVNALEKNSPVFIEFYAPRCPACRQMEPVIMALQKKYDRQVKFIIANTDSSGSSLANEFGVLYIPAYIFINSSGERVGDDLAGYQSEEELTAMLENLLEN